MRLLVTALTPLRRERERESERERERERERSRKVWVHGTCTAVRGKARLETALRQAYRGTSLTRNSALLGPYCRTLPRALGGS